MLERETLPASAGSLCIGVIEHKSFAIESSRILQYRAYQIKKTLFIYYDTYGIIFKYLIGLTGLFWKI